MHVYIAMRVPVHLLPSRSLRYSGSCQLSITSQSVQVVDVSDTARRTELQLVFWPVAAIRHCGYHHKLLLIRTGELVCCLRGLKISLLISRSRF